LPERNLHIFSLNRPRNRRHKEQLAISSWQLVQPKQTQSLLYLALQGHDWRSMVSSCELRQCR
jgi:hypothetical protein